MKEREWEENEAKRRGGVKKKREAVKELNEIK